MVKTTLTDVNAGSALNGSELDLQVTRVDVQGEVFTSTRDIPNQTNTGAVVDRLGSGIYSGFGNPIISVEGIYDSTFNTSGSQITYTNFKDFIKFGFVYQLLDDMLGSTNVMIKNYSFQRDNSGSEGHAPTYSIGFVEVHA